jgi:hypothetical protein
MEVSMKIRFASAAFIATISLATFAAGSVLAATSPAMQACSKQWSDMKKANKVPEGEKWSEFWSQCSKDYAAKNGGDTGAGEAASTEKTAKPKKTAAVSEDDSASSGQQKKDCDAKWDANKTKTGAHGWHDYFQFMAKCM